MIVIPDADQTPEQLAGLADGVPAESQVARRLAENGYRVIVPALIDRTVAARNGRAQADEPRVPLSFGVRAGAAPDRVRGSKGVGSGRRSEIEISKGTDRRS